MSSNSKHKAECKTAAGQTSKREGSGEAWKQFWATAESKTKKRQKKPLTREESKRRKQVKQAKKKQEEGGRSFERQKTLLTSVAGFISQRNADSL